MKAAIYATLFHCMSTDQKPQQKKCPSVIDSWCFYKSSLARGEPISEKKSANFKVAQQKIKLAKLRRRKIEKTLGPMYKSGGF
ncbi:hypothetical protein TNCV_704771 [Trichonephila clavipes]|nr:hypothetical protein TNCV_704771 [Trichonephila clavipes]